MPLDPSRIQPCPAKHPSYTSRDAAEQPPEYDDEDILREFEYHRVSVDIDVFMEHVLHVPENWRELWRRTIVRIKHDETSLISCWDHRRECEIQGAEESKFYRPLVDMANAVLDFLAKDSLDESVKLRTPQRYLTSFPSANVVSANVWAIVDFPVPARPFSQKTRWSCSPVNQHSISCRTSFRVPLRHPFLFPLRYPASAARCMPSRRARSADSYILVSSRGRKTMGRDSR